MDFTKHSSDENQNLTKEKNTRKRSLSSLWDTIKKSSFIWGPQLNDVGVSIGHRNIIVVEIDNKENIPRLVKFAVREVSSDNPNISSILKELFETEGISNSLINTSISGKSIIVRFIRFPKMGKKDLKNSLQYEAEKYIPFDVSQVYLDYDIVGDEENKKFYDIALVAAKREGVDDLLLSCKSADLGVKVIDVDSFACLNTFLCAYPEEVKSTVALVNIGARITNLLIMSQGVPAFSRDVYFGGDDITAGLSKRLHIAITEAAQLKFNLKEIDDSNVKIIIREILAYLITEMKLSFDYFQNQDPKKQQKINKVYLIGGTSRLEGLKDIIQQAIDVPTHFFDPLRCVTIDPALDHNQLNDYSASLAVPIGLALRI